MSESSLVIGGRYQRLDKLGSGGAGDVHRGLDTHTGEPIAIKCLRSDLITSNPQLLERFIREGEILRQLDHPNIVKMLAAIDEKGQHYIIMEYVAGGSLRDRLANEPPPSLENVLSIALDLTDALTHTHRQNIVHRDLKPSNVLLAESGAARLTDFGTAYLLGTSHLTQEGMIIGTPHYFSPEAINNQPLDARADIWGLGILLFEMLTGYPPFDAPHLNELMLAILRQPAPDLAELRPDIPIGLVDLVSRMLEKDPAVRIPSVRLVGAELEAILQSPRRDPQFNRRILHDGTSVFATPPPEPGAPKHNLPVQTTVFVGRSEELEALAQLVADPTARLVTILGPGGMGKTRLALEVAAQQIAHFPNGAYFVSLASLTNPADIIPAVAETVGFQFQFGGLGGRTEGTCDCRARLLDFLRTKRHLLIMDNFDHLLDGADLLADIVGAAPGVKILVTSRERLNLSSEILFTLGGMEFPDWETPHDAPRYDAVKLFMQSARRVAPGFELQSADLRDVARICWLVGGMPLGILLAAGWVDMFSVQEIASEIGQSLDFLEATWRDVPDRHRSMRAVFDSAWKQLDEDGRVILGSLSVFRGGFTREAAQQVAGASLRALVGLVNKSLLRRDPGSGRYEMHELLRQYAEEQPVASHDLEALRDRHCAYYAEMASRREGILLFEIPREVLTELDNLCLAWEHGLSRLRLDDLRQLWPLLFDICQQYSLIQQSHNLFGRAPEILRTAEPSRERNLLLGLTLTLQGGTALSLGYQAEGIAQVTEGLAVLESLGWSLERLVAEPYRFTSRLNRKPSEARQQLEGYLAFSQGLGLRQFAALALAALAEIAAQEGNTAETLRLCRESVAVARESGSRYCIVRNLSNLLALASAMGCWTANTEEYLHEIIRMGRLYNIPYATLAGLNTLTYAALRRNDTAQAEHLAQEAVALAQDIGDLGMIWNAHDTLGDVKYALGDFEHARQLFQQNLVGMSDAVHTFMRPRTHGQLGFVALASGTDVEQSQQHFTQSLDRATYPREKVDSLIGFAILAARGHNPEYAVELLAVTCPYDFPDIHSKEAARLRADLAAKLPPEVFAAAWERGAERTLDEVVAELLGREPAEKTQPLLDPLSERELEVLRLVAAGFSNREIAEKLVISLGTVKIHTHNIYSKLSVDSRTKAILRANDLGLLREAK